MGIQGNFNDWRKDMIELLDEYAKDGIKHVVWSTAEDDFVCKRCSSREGKRYTIEEARKALEGEFCKPEDPDDRCRCTFLAD